jgi:hypothetical protein
VKCQRTHVKEEHFVLPEKGTLLFWKVEAKNPLKNNRGFFVAMCVMVDLVLNKADI